MTKDELKANDQAIDREFGSRLRAAREARNMSQEALGDRLGITFQQVQKYEKGVNRVGFSRLVAICKILELDPNFFATGMLDGQADEGGEAPSFGGVMAENKVMKDRLHKINKLSADWSAA